jgi:hypothetical protein
MNDYLRSVFVWWVVLLQLGLTTMVCSLMYSLIRPEVEWLFNWLLGRPQRPEAEE